MSLADTLAQFGILSDTTATAAEPTPAADGAAQVAAQPLLVLESLMQALEEPFQKMLSLAGAAAARMDALVRAARPPADRMEAWLMAAEQHRIPPGEITNAIEVIQTAARQIRAGAGNSKPWEQLGISPGQDPLDVLDQMHACASAFAPALVRPILADAGIGDDMFLLFRRREPGFHGLDASDRPQTPTTFPERVSEFAQALMATARKAASHIPGILSGLRDSAAQSLHIEDFTNAWAGSAPENIFSEKSLAWIDDAFREAAEPVGNALRLASGLVDAVGQNNMDKLMGWLAPVPDQNAPGVISPSFLSQPTTAPALRALPVEPAAPPLQPNTTMNVTQHIEATTNPQKAAEEVIRRMIEMTAVQFPAESY